MYMSIVGHEPAALGVVEELVHRALGHVLELHPDADRLEPAGEELADLLALRRRVAGEQAQRDRLALLVEELAADGLVAGAASNCVALAGRRRTAVPAGGCQCQSGFV